MMVNEDKCSDRDADVKDEVTHFGYPSKTCEDESDVVEDGYVVLKFSYHLQRGS